MKAFTSFVIASFFAIIDVASAQNSTETSLVRIEHISDVDCASPCDRTAVLFIHGITGGQDTWLNDETQAYWPNLIATDPELGSQVDVFSIDYESDAFSGPSFVTILRELDQRLDEILMNKNYQKAIFVAHSLGGNLARAYLHHLKMRFGHRAMSTFRLVFTLGTPNQGSSLANFAKWLSGNEQMRVLTTLSENDFQQHLNMSTYDILAKHEGSCPDLSFFAAYEMKPMPPVGIIVSRESATALSDGSTIKGFALNHSELAKPSDRDDPLYRWIADEVSECLNGDHLCGGPLEDMCSDQADDGPDPRRPLEN